MEMVSEKFCQVCSRPGGIINFGAISCLACAAFFRRSMALSLSYKCKCQNGSKNKKAKFPPCKQCRLERCFEAGMKKELVRAVSMRSFHMKRQIEMLEKQYTPSNLHNSLILFNGKNPHNVGFFKNLIELAERTYQVWFSMAPLPSKQLDKTLVELLDSHDNILARNGELTNISVQKFNKCELLRNIENNGIAVEWHECPCRISAIRSTLICISLMMALPAFHSLDLQTRDDLAHKLLVSPMKLFANVGLDKLESILLIYILLCSPAASTGLSKEAQLILLKESEKFGKMLLQLQQHRFGQHAGALRYMESQRLIWTAVECKSIYQRILSIFDNAANNGISRAYPRIIYALFEN